MERDEKRVTFTDHLKEQVERKHSCLCLGIDPLYHSIPPHLKRRIGDGGKSLAALGELFWVFGKEIIDATAPYVVAVKPNIACFLVYGADGLRAYERILVYARRKHLLAIGDVKCSDGGHIAELYADGLLGTLPFWETPHRDDNRIVSPIQGDAVTITMATGSSGIRPFAKAAAAVGAGVFVLAKVSFRPKISSENSPTGREEEASYVELDRLKVGTHGEPLWEWIGHQVRKIAPGTEGYSGWWNIGVVAGSTYPQEMKVLRDILPHSWFLGPGYDRQGAKAEHAVAAVDDDGLGCLPSSSRGIDYAYLRERFRRPSEGFAEAARDAAKAARDDLNRAIERVLEKRRKPK